MPTAITWVFAESAGEGAEVGGPPNQGLAAARRTGNLDACIGGNSFKICLAVADMWGCLHSVVNQAYAQP